MYRKWSHFNALLQKLCDMVVIYTKINSYESWQVKKKCINKLNIKEYSDLHVKCNSLPPEANSFQVFLQK